MKRAEEKVILAILASAALVSSVMMLIVYRLIKKNFIRPIGLLTKSAKAMVDNLEREKAVSIDIHTNDELETLADAFTKMYPEKAYRQPSSWSLQKS